MPDTIDRLKASLADRYTIERELGVGGMATVYLAKDLKHRRQVAIKVLRPELAASLGVERFVREIEIAANLTHPHILPLHDSGEADGFLYYLMPYIEGESLRERLNREGKLSVQEVVRLTDEIAAALSYAHEHGIVHRDIKPENIMLSGGRAVVADFGIARAVEVAGGERLTGTGIAVGTPTYMSPEQAMGQADVDARSDVYALGCVVYEMVAGCAPFEGDTPQALLAKHAVDTAPSLRTSDLSIPLFLQRAVERALAKRPDERFQTASAFAEALTSELVVARVGRRRWPCRSRVASARRFHIGGMRKYPGTKQPPWRNAIQSASRIQALDVSRKLEPELASLPWLAHHPDGASVRLDRELAEGQPETRRVLLSLVVRFDLPELLEDLLAVLSRNARARILDTDQWRTALVGQCDVYCSLLRREVERVAHEVRDHSANDARVALDRYGITRLLQLESPPSRECSKRLERVCDNGT